MMTTGTSAAPHARRRMPACGWRLSGLNAVSFRAVAMGAILLSACRDRSQAWMEESVRVAKQNGGALAHCVMPVPIDVAGDCVGSAGWVGTAITLEGRMYLHIPKGDQAPAQGPCFVEDGQHRIEIEWGSFVDSQSVCSIRVHSR